ncbi:MAG: type I DNA topoisomerase [Bacteroidetes bacterium]|nr:type I DNA topoisomerase [Bacteroidota bacterium]
MSKNLVIVESPAKAKTIEKFLGNDFVVKSSFGHVRDLSKKTISIDIEHNFQPQYEISPDKVKVVSELKKLAKSAETVWLASDEDREGEAISWHLMEALDLKENKIKRIVFHEITKTAILEAVENPRSIDINLVNAQQARRVLDRLVGYELSPVLWKKVKPALSAGRVQSVAVRLIVEREDEIRNFTSNSFFRVIGIFDIKNSDKNISISAELSQRFDNKQDAIKFLNDCINANFTVADVETKPAKKSPAPPFTTSTLQQEASRKLGFPVAKTMVVAQQLYESGFITYMRTDSVNLSNMALAMAKKEIEHLYGEDYVKIRKYTTKTKGAQEAHEAIRPTYLNNQSINGDASQKRLYDLIWKRTIASQMSEALLEKTNITIENDKRKENFIARGEVIKFDGFLKVYLESSDDEDDENQKDILPPIKKGEKLTLNECNATQSFTQYPPRYTEASLVKKLEDLGIGRPSTYAPTISTIQKREYVVKEDRDGVIRKFDVITLKNKSIKEIVKSEKTGFEKNKLFPTDIGSIVNRFLVQHFETILDYNFTAKVEKDFDEIAEGQIVWNDMIKSFYIPFHKNVEKTMIESERAKGERLLGIDPKTKRNVYVRIGRFGAMAQIGEAKEDEKPSFAGLKKGQSLDTITLEQALELFNLPRTVGTFEDAEMVVSIGRFGPYVRHDAKFYSLTKTDDPYEVSEERCIEIIKAKRISDSAKAEISKHFPKVLGEYEKVEVIVNIGRYGPYITYNTTNFPIPKSLDILKLNLAEAIEFIQGKKSKNAERIIKEFPENSDVKVLNGRYGAYLKVGKDNFKIPGGREAKDLTLAECLGIAKDNAKPGKKTTSKKTSAKKAVSSKTKKK